MFLDPEAPSDQDGAFTRWRGGTSWAGAQDSPDVCDEVGMIGVAKVVRDAGEGNVRFCSHPFGCFLKSSPSNQCQGGHADVLPRKSLKGAVRQVEFAGDVVHGSEGGVGLDCRHDAVGQESLLGRLAGMGRQPIGECVDRARPVVSATDHGCAHRIEKVGHVYNSNGVPQAGGGGAELRNGCWAEQCAHRPATSGQVADGRSRCRAGQPYEVGFDDQVAGRESDDLLTGGAARFAIPLRDPEPAHKVTDGPGGGNPRERRESGGVQDAAVLMLHSDKSVANVQERQPRHLLPSGNEHTSAR